MPFKKLKFKNSLCKAIAENLLRCSALLDKYLRNDLYLCTNAIVDFFFYEATKWKIQKPIALCRVFDSSLEYVVILCTEYERELIHVA